MGKNLIQQARGKGGPTYRAPSFRYKGKATNLSYKHEGAEGKVSEFVKCQGHSAPLSVIKWNNGNKTLSLAVEGQKIGDIVISGGTAEIMPGNTLALNDIPEGTLINNIEARPGDGGKFVRASGTFAKIVGKMKNQVIVLLPSKKEKTFNLKCRATIGTLAGGGRLDKPFYKAGKKYHRMRAKNKLYPKVCGVSMNAVDHPFGGSSSSNVGRPTQAHRGAPPGRKVGKLHPRRTGLRKR